MSKDKEQDQFEPEIEEKEEKRGNKPWNRKFGEDENLKNRQYSRTARNQPAKEATTLSKVLLFIIIITVLAPFILFFIVEAQRDTQEIPNRTAADINISRSIDIEESASEDESVEESVEEESVEEESESEVNRESIESVESIPPPEPEPETTPTPPTPTVPETPVETAPPAQTGATYVVQAGDTWYGIARNYGIDVYELLALNNAGVDTPIHPGNVVNVPY